MLGDDHVAVGYAWKQDRLTELAENGARRSEVLQTCLRHARPANQGSVVTPSWFHAGWARRDRFDRCHRAEPERGQVGERRIKRRGFISARVGRVSRTRRGVTDEEIAQPGR